MLDTIRMRERVENCDPRAERIADEHEAPRVFAIENAPDAIENHRHRNGAAARLALAMSGKIGNDDAIFLDERGNDCRPRSGLVVHAVNENDDRRWRLSATGNPINDAVQLAALHPCARERIAGDLDVRSGGINGRQTRSHFSASETRLQPGCSRRLIQPSRRDRSA